MSINEPRLKGTRSQDLDAQSQLYRSEKNFQLENGSVLPELEIAYHTFGKLNEQKNNVIWVCHALTANSNVFDWWKGLFGTRDYFNPEKYFIVCANNLGSCYGSTGPLSINPGTNEPWYAYFPQITTKDIASSLGLLRNHLGIEKIHTLIGGSQGGQIALEWSLLQPSIADNLILIATNAQHSAWGIAFNESQRLAVKADRTYYSNCADAALKGLSAARSIALLGYRGYTTYELTQKENRSDKTIDFAAASYQRYQGEKLAKRFNAYSYVRLLEAMDSHNIARGRQGNIAEVLKQITSNTLVINIKSDILFPSVEQKLLARHIPNTTYAEIESIYGHDGFLIETKELSWMIKVHYAQEHCHELHELTLMNNTATNYTN
jgi:homoserine O-acetyltransferase